MPAAGRSSIAAHRRSLMTATAAGAVLCALWFVPSAKATPEAPGTGGARHAVTSPSGPAHAADPAPPSKADGQTSAAYGTARPAPGSEGLTTPFVLSTLVLAGAGGALIVRIRSRATVACSRAAQASSPAAD